MFPCDISTSVVDDVCPEYFQGINTSMHEDMSPPPYLIAYPNPPMSDKELSYLSPITLQQDIPVSEVLISNVHFPSVDEANLMPLDNLTYQPLSPPPYLFAYSNPPVSDSELSYLSPTTPSEANLMLFANLSYQPLSPLPSADNFSLSLASPYSDEYFANYGFPFDAYKYRGATPLRWPCLLTLIYHARAEDNEVLCTRKGQERVPQALCLSVWLFQEVSETV